MEEKEKGDGEEGGLALASEGHDMGSTWPVPTRHQRPALPLSRSSPSPNPGPPPAPLGAACPLPAPSTGPRALVVSGRPSCSHPQAPTVPYQTSSAPSQTKKEVQSTGPWATTMAATTMKWESLRWSTRRCRVGSTLQSRRTKAGGGMKPPGGVWIP